jgi:tetratricopeptide (TPR) repeat protein
VPVKKTADVFAPLRRVLSTEAALLADVLTGAVLDEEGVSSPGVDEALLECALRLRETCLGRRSLEAGITHQLLAGLHEDEGRKARAAKHYRDALRIYEKLPAAEAQLATARDAYGRLLVKMGRKAEARALARRKRKS